MSFPAQKLALGGLLVSLTITAYLPAFQAGYVWDDDRHVTHNKPLRSVEGLAAIWFEPTSIPQYYPVTHTTFWVEYRFWGLKPLGYHLVNVLLHAANGMLLWSVLRRLGVPAAWFAAAIFALHPVHVESVAWISERKNVLSGLFYLASALMFLRFDEARIERNERGWGSYGASLLLYAAALLSKTVAATLPVVLLLVLWWKRGRVFKTDVLLAPLFALGVPLGLLTVWLEKHHVGAVGDDWDLSWIERALIAGRAFWFYMGKLVWPSSVTFIYPRWQIDVGVWWQYLFPVAALATLIGTCLWQRTRTIGLAAACFTATLAPALSFFDVFPMRYSFVADHFQYLASIAPISLFVAFVWSEVRRAAGVAGAWPMVAGAAVLASLWLMTWQQSRAYSDLETLWRDTLRKNPECPMAHHNLGNVLQQQGRLHEAGTHFRQVLQWEPADTLARNNLANILLLQSRFAEAVEEYRQVLDAEPHNALAHYNLANACESLGRDDDAIEHYQQALRAEPDNPLAHNNLGLLLSHAGRTGKAIEHFRQALAIDPEFAFAHVNLGSALLQIGDRELALKHAREAVRLDPALPQAQEILRQAASPPK